MKISIEAQLKLVLQALEELRDAVNNQYPKISERVIEASNKATNVINKYK